jgi:hypothetical protein
MPWKCEAVVYRLPSSSVQASTRIALTKRVLSTYPIRTQDPPYKGSDAGPVQGEQSTQLQGIPSSSAKSSVVRLNARAARRRHLVGMLSALRGIQSVIHGKWLQTINKLYSNAKFDVSWCVQHMLIAGIPAAG